MSSPVTGSVPPPDTAFKPVSGSTQNPQELLNGALEFLGALSQVKPAPGETLQDAQARFIDTLNGHQTTHQSPATSNPELVITLLDNPALLEKLGENVALALGVILATTHPSLAMRMDAGDLRTDEQLKVSVEAHTANYSAAIGNAGSAPRGSPLQMEMFSSASIELATILAEVSQMKKGQAKEYAHAMLNAMKAMIDGAHTQAQIERDIGQTNATAAFMSAGLQAAGAGISFMGAARGIQMAREKIQLQHPDGTLAFEKKPGSDPVPIMVPNPTAQAMATNVGTMWQSVGQLFSQTGTSIVEGQKAGTLGNLEALKAILNSAMQILGQMMSKWGDAEKEAHDAQNALAQSMQEAFKAFVASADKLAP